MKKMLPALLIALTLLSASAAEPPRLSFDRPSKPGAYFNAEISLTAVREYTIALPGPDKPIERRESLNATLFAGIKVLEVDETGAPVRLEIRISSSGGFLNGRRFNSVLLNRKTVLADLRGGTSRFRMPQPIPRLNPQPRLSCPRSSVLRQCLSRIRWELLRR